MSDSKVEENVEYLQFGNLKYKPRIRNAIRYLLSLNKKFNGLMPYDDYINFCEEDLNEIKITEYVYGIIDLVKENPNDDDDFEFMEDTYNIMIIFRKKTKDGKDGYISHTIAEIKRHQFKNMRDANILTDSFFWDEIKSFNTEKRIPCKNCSTNISEPNESYCLECSSQISFREEEDKCSICLEAGEGIWIKTKCNHIFHNTCFLNIKVDDYKRKCPLCREKNSYADTILL